MSGNETKISVFTSGSCTGNNRHIHRGESSKTLVFPALWGLIEHPDLGNILFDTGYSGRFLEITRHFPEAIYRWITPVTIPGEDECFNQLQEFRMEASQIDHVVVSHFHADHIGGLKDFSSSLIWCQERGLNQILKLGLYRGVSKALLNGLLPNDIKQRAKFPEQILNQVYIHGLSCWEWGRGIWFVDLPGHARGQMGLLIKGSNLGDVMFIADAAWSEHGYRDRIYPSRMVSIISDGYSQMTRTLDLVHQYHLANPDTLIVPTHCLGTFNSIRSKSQKR